MQLLVLLGLGALWIAVLLPDIMRRRSTRRPIDTITSFKRHLSVLERQHARTNGRAMPMGGNVVSFGARQPQRSLSGPVRPLVAPGGSQRPAVAQQQLRQAPALTQRPHGGSERRSGAQQRRQDVIVALLAASLLSFLATLTFSHFFLYLHVAIDVALVAYVGAVLSLTRRNQARSQVSYLRTGQAHQSPTTMATVSAPANRYVAR